MQLLSSLLGLTDSALGERLGVFIAIIFFSWYGTKKETTDKPKRLTQLSPQSASVAIAKVQPPVSPSPIDPNKQIAEFLGVQHGLDTSTPEDLVHWVVHLAEKMGQLFGAIIVDQFPVSETVERAVGIVHFEFAKYGRLFLMASAKCNLTQHGGTSFSQQALALLNSTVTLQRKRDVMKMRDTVRDMSIELRRPDDPSWQTTIKVLEDGIARDYSLFDKCEITPATETHDAKHPCLALAVYIAETFYPPAQRAGVARCVHAESAEVQRQFFSYIFSYPVKDA